MTNPSAPVLDRTTPIRDGCGCFANAVPMPMGCALCGHAPYAHGCLDRPADHEYAQPSGALTEMRLEARRHGGPCILPAVEPPVDVAPTEVIPLVPAQRRPDLPVIAPAAPVVRPPLPKRTPRPVRRPAPPFRATAAPPRREDGRRPAPPRYASGHRPCSQG